MRGQGGDYTLNVVVVGTLRQKLTHKSGKISSTSRQKRCPGPFTGDFRRSPVGTTGPGRRIEPRRSRGYECPSGVRSGNSRRLTTDAIDRKVVVSFVYLLTRLLKAPLGRGDTAVARYQIQFGFRRPRALPGYLHRCSGSHSCPRISGRKTYPRRRRTSESVARSTSLRMNFRHGSKASANRPSRGAVAARPSPIESCAVGTKWFRAVGNSASLLVISRPIDRSAGACIVRASPALDAR